LPELGEIQTINAVFAAEAAVAATTEAGVIETTAFIAAEAVAAVVVAPILIS